MRYISVLLLMALALFKADESGVAVVGDAAIAVVPADAMPPLLTTVVVPPTLPPLPPMPPAPGDDARFIESLSFPFEPLISNAKHWSCYSLSLFFSPVSGSYASFCGEGVLYALQTYEIFVTR
jgi:hypothetical protein